MRNITCVAHTYVVSYRIICLQCACVKETQRHNPRFCMQECIRCANYEKNFVKRLLESRFLTRQYIIKLNANLRKTKLARMSRVHSKNFLFSFRLLILRVKSFFFLNTTTIILLRINIFGHILSQRYKETSDVRW